MRKKSNQSGSNSLETVQEKIDKLKVFGLSAEKQKNEAIAKILEARSKGLKTQEEQARGMACKSMAMKKQADAMLMTLELALQSRDLVSLQGQFLQCMNDVAKTIGEDVDKTNAKRASKQYVKAMTKSEKQAESIDRLIEECDIATSILTNVDDYSDYEGEIDSLIEEAEVQRVEEVFTVRSRID